MPNDKTDCLLLVIFFLKMMIAPASAWPMPFPGLHPDPTAIFLLTSGPNDLPPVLPENEKVSAADIDGIACMRLRAIKE